MLHPLQRVLDPWSLTERSVFVGATGSHFASTVSIERLRCLNLPGSLHLSGQAIDIRLADAPLATLRDPARSMRSGGVGYYAASDFVHVDTGRVRSW